MTVLTNWFQIDCSHYRLHVTKIAVFLNMASVILFELSADNFRYLFWSENPWKVGPFHFSCPGKHNLLKRKYALIFKKSNDIVEAYNDNVADESDQSPHFCHVDSFYF